MNLIDAFLDLLYPPKCIICEEPISDYGYCAKCDGKLKPISEEMCIICGSRRKFCECKERVYHFDAVAAPYFNEGYARQGVYDLKFHNKFNCLKPFGKEMSLRAKKCFGIENIDLICPVPASVESYNERGFNQSDLFAREISEHLKIEYKPKLIKKLETVKSQHRIKSLEDRFNNVRNGFKVYDSIKGKNVLLVDDIKTTGATIDECARQLKFAGADKVYCIVALITEKQHNLETYDL